MSKRDEIADIIEDWTASGSRVESLQLADRILACIAEPSEAMVKAAAKIIQPDGWDRYLLKSYPSGAKTFRRVARTKARAALVAAGRAMVGGNDATPGR